MPRPLAESLLQLDFPGQDAARIDELNDLLTCWQSKARKTLPTADMTGRVLP
jgi:hypothetical protein